MALSGMSVMELCPCSCPRKSPIHSPHCRTPNTITIGNCAFACLPSSFQVALPILCVHCPGVQESQWQDQSALVVIFSTLPRCLCLPVAPSLSPPRTFHSSSFTLPIPDLRISHNPNSTPTARRTPHRLRFLEKQLRHIPSVER